MKIREIVTLYEDPHILLVNKPSGLPTIPDRHRPDIPHLRGILEKQYGRLWIVHRIDADTSGVLCLARNAEAHRALSLQFEQRKVEKRYLALLEGCPDPPEGRIKAPIAHHPSQPGKMRVHTKGKESLSHYRVLEKLGPACWAEIRIETGRTHQVRVHMQYIQHPLWVDPLYGRRDAFYLSEWKGSKYKSSRNREERPLLARLSLHAARLTVEHPVHGEPVSAEAPLPKDLTATLRQMRKWTGL